MLPKIINFISLLLTLHINQDLIDFAEKGESLKFFDILTHSTRIYVEGYLLKKGNDIEE